LTASALPALADDPILSRLAGDWVGRGMARTSATAKAELAYCRISARLIDGGTTLEQKGRCAIATNSGNIKGRIAAVGGGKYRGALESFSTIGPMQLAGSGTDGKIELNAKFVDRKTRQPAEAIVSLVLAGDGKYRLVSNQLAPDGKSRFLASDIVFTPQ
jgi:hypothetical protein